MAESFELPSVDRLTTGTVGPPGARVFYLQATAGGQVVTLQLEKEQVAALAQFLAARLADLPQAEPETVPADPHPDLVEPLEPAWTVGDLGIGYDEDTDRIVVVAEELVLDDEDDEASGADEPDPLLRALDEAASGAVARFGLTRSQVAAFVARAAEVVAAGRPVCPVCARPMDPEGHVCVRANGHRAR
jgi:uncharacterized repeat protein (TIGR03847 family)